MMSAQHKSPAAHTAGSLNTKMPALGIDLGGTKLSAAVVADCRLISEVQKVPTPKGPTAIVEAMLQMIDSFRQDHLLAGVGIATAGIVNSDSGQIIGSTGNLPGWEGTSVKSIIEEKTMLPVHVENDANAAAYGEAMAAGFSDKTCTITVTLGTGIGVGIVIAGKLYRGAHWAAGEGGHMRVSLDNQRLCTCGLWDCWEAYGSGRGLIATADSLRSQYKQEQSLLKAIDKITTQAIFEAKAQGDLLACQVIELWHEHLCAGLTNLAHILDPDSFLITGGLSQFVDYSLLQELLADRLMPRVAESISIHKSLLGNSAGMVGAAQLALDSLAKPSNS